MSWLDVRFICFEELELRSSGSEHGSNDVVYLAVCQAEGRWLVSNSPLTKSRHPRNQGTANLLHAQTISRSPGKGNVVSLHGGRHVRQPPFREEFHWSWKDGWFSMQKVRGHANGSARRNHPVLETKRLVRRNTWAAVHRAKAETTKPMLAVFFLLHRDEWSGALWWEHTGGLLWWRLENTASSPAGPKSVSLLGSHRKGALVLWQDASWSRDSPWCSSTGIPWCRPWWWYRSRLILVPLWTYVGHWARMAACRCWSNIGIKSDGHWLTCLWLPWQPSRASPYPDGYRTSGSKRN